MNPAAQGAQGSASAPVLYMALELIQHAVSLFPDMSLKERSFGHSTFSKNRARLIEHGIAKEFRRTFHPS